MAEMRVWVEGGNVEAVEGPMQYIGQGEKRIWIEGGNIAITGGGGGSTVQGEWDAGTAYAAGDLVTYNQNLYVALQATTGDTPPQNNGGTYTTMQQFDPATPVNSEAGDISIGIMFQVDQDCQLVASLFYKGDATNGGTHVGRIWNAETGAQIDNVTYTGETASGWQRQQFAAPVPLFAGTLYVHSVDLPQAHYSNTTFFMRTGPFTDGPVRVGSSAFNANLNTMPTDVFNDIFYFNAIEVVVPSNPDWQLLGKGDWGAP